MSFAPVARPKLAGTTEPDGGTVACWDGARVALFALRDLAALGEVALGDPAPADADIAFVEQALLVALPHPDRTVIHVIAPRSLDVIAETELAAGMRLLAAGGPHALFSGPAGVQQLTLERARIAVASLRMRDPVRAAWVGADGRAVFNLGQHIETWDLAHRRPMQRLRTERPVSASAIGVTASSYWLVPTGRPDHVEVLPRSGTAPPWARPADGRITGVVGGEPGHLAVIATDEHAPIVVDLSTRDAPSTALAQPAAHALWAAGAVVVTATTGAPLRLWRLHTPGSRKLSPQLIATTADDGDGADAPASTDDAAAAPAIAASTAAGPTVSERLREWRERLRPARRIEPASPAVVVAKAGWRTDLLAWARAVLDDGSTEQPPWVTASSLAKLAALTGLSTGASRGLALLYAAHLDGVDGVSRAELARVIADDKAWDEALGRGVLAAGSLAEWERHRVRLGHAASLALDERPPEHVELIPGRDDQFVSLAGPCLIVAVEHTSLTEIAAAAGATVGASIAICAPTPVVATAPALIEARLRGAVPLMTAGDDTSAALLDAIGPCLVVVTPDNVEALALPVLVDLTEARA